MPDKELYIKLSGGSPEVEVGPFQDKALSISTTEASLDGVKFAEIDGGVWHITDGAVLGDEHLTDTESSVILGQAKLAE